MDVAMNGTGIGNFIAKLAVFFLLALSTQLCLANPNRPDQDPAGIKDSTFISRDSGGIAADSTVQRELTDGAIIGIVIGIACLVTLMFNVMIFTSLNTSR